MSDFWLNCDSCGRQNVGVTFVNGMRFCAKCYQETFGNTNVFEKELRDEIKVLEKALELAVSQLDDAKDMLRDVGKNDWAGMIDTSVDYFKARAKEMKDE